MLDVMLGLDGARMGEIQLAWKRHSNAVAFPDFARILMSHLPETIYRDDGAPASAG